MATRGRPTFAPTENQRGQVEAMKAYGISEEAISDKLGITRNTLRKHFKNELRTGRTTANSIVGEFLFATITGKNGFKDDPARVTAAIFWAKTQMGWKQTNVHQHEGTEDGPPIKVSLVRERIRSKLARLAPPIGAAEDPGESQ